MELPLRKLFICLCFLYGNSALGVLTNIEINDILSDMDQLVEEDPAKAISLGEELLGEIESNSTDPILFKVYVQMIAAHRVLGEYEKALSLSNKGIFLAIESGNSEMLAELYHETCGVYWKRGDLEKSLKFVELSMEIQRELGNQDGIAVSLNSLGLIYWQKGVYALSLENHYASLEIKEENNDELGMAHSYNNLGLVVADLGKYEESLAFHERARKIREEYGEKLSLAATYSNMGEVYQNLNDFDRALAYQELSLALEKEIGNRDGIALSITNIAELYLKSGRPEEAIEMAIEALAINEEIQSAFGQIIANRDIGLGERALGNYEAALFHFKKSLEMAKSSLMAHHVSELMLEISKTYEGMHEYVEALKYYKEFKISSEGIMNSSSLEKINELEAIYQTVVKDRELVLSYERIQNMETKSKLSQTVRDFLILVITLVILILFILWNRYRIKTASEKSLRQINEELNAKRKLIEEQAGKISLTNESLLDLNEKMNELNQALEQSPTSVIITDLKGDILYVNSTFTQVSEYSEQEVIGKNPRFLKSGNMDPRIYLELWESVSLGNVWIGELEHRKKSGEIYWERLVMSPIKGSDGNIIRYVGASEDITLSKTNEEESLRRRMEAEIAEAADQAKGVFLASVGKEMKAPLNSVLGFTNLLSQSSLDKEQVKYLDRITESGQRLLSMVENVLDFNRAEMGTMEFENKPFKPSDVLGRLMKFFQVETAQRNIILNNEISENMPKYLLGDEKRFRQIIFSLLKNAVFQTMLGEINFRLAFEFNEGLQVWEINGEVEDSGEGTSRNSADKLMKPYDESQSRSGDLGTDVGLALCQRLCQLQGGNLTSTSELNKGSVYQFSLKMKVMNANNDSPADSGTLEGVSFSKNYPLNILIAEDNRINRRLLETLMKRLGYVAVFAVDGLGVINEVKKSNFDLIFMDIQMPHLDGIGAATQIRSGDLGAEIRKARITAITAFVSIENQILCREAGMDGFLPKPIEIELIKKEIIKAFEVKCRRIKSVS